MFKDWHATRQEQPTKKTWGFGICCCVRQQHHQQMNPAAIGCLDSRNNRTPPVTIK